MTPTPSTWWSSFFDQTYAGFGLRGDDPQVPAIVDFLQQRLEWPCWINAAAWVG